jgi:hypothetical protein
MLHLSKSLKPQWLLLAILLACYPLSYITPPTWAWEDGVIENSQVVILLAGFLGAWVTYLRERPNKIALLALATMPIWAILVARELSWGAVFTAPLTFNHDGPVYSSHVLFYKPMVAPTVGVLLLWSLWLAWRHRLDKLVLEMIATHKFPWFALGMCALGMAGSACAEGHLELGLPIAPEHAEALEELTELAAYGAIVFAQEAIYRAYTAVATATRTARLH